MTTGFFYSLDPADEYWLRFNFERSMTDPFPELPRRVLYVDVTKPKRAGYRPLLVEVDGAIHVTKPFELEPVTKPVTKPRGGRPAKGDKPMTSAERVRLHRAAKKAR